MRKEVKKRKKKNFFPVIKNTSSFILGTRQNTSNRILLLKRN
ncbi:hypothetical protein HMPREF0373_02412 [Eubacterium ramulus ATCC 29099]|uniref:Uncharacterized protein n=1 Tax=Eubacterium ramulus ATCC 29099 TaxID=1256908 RepID=U2QXM5_EUBRA|nr:hypothetical protein HMPREF0373_02412 [Eubacterium ramulus ATCC 29099]